MPQGPERRDRGPRKGGPRSGSPRSGGPRSGGSRSGGPRSSDPGSGSPRSGGPRSGGPRSGSPRGGGSRNGASRKFSRNPNGGTRPARREDESGERRPRRDSERSERRPRREGERSERRPRRDSERSDRRPRREGERSERPIRPQTAAQRRADEVRQRTGGRKFKRGEVPYERPAQERWVDEGPVRKGAKRVRRDDVPRTQTSSASVETVQSRALGALNAALGEREGAKQAKRLATALDSFQAERWRDVKQVLVPMAQIAPEVAMVRELLGLALYRLGEWLRAADHLEASRRFDPAQTVALPVLADCYRALKRHEDVDRLWKELRDVSPDAATVAEGRIIASSSLADRGDLAGAIRLMEKAAREPARPQEHHLRSWYVLADLYDRAGEVVKARNTFLRIRKYDKSFYDVQQRLEDLGK